MISPSQKLIKRFYKPEYYYRPHKIIDRIRYKFFPPAPDLQKVALVWGSEIWAKPYQTIGKSLFTFGIYDLPLSEMIFRLVRPGDCVVDVGANIGYTSLLMLKRLKGEGRLLSFEPMPQLFQILKRNVEASGTGVVELNELALSSKTGEASLTLPQTFSINDGVATLESKVDGEKIRIKTSKLDDFNIEGPVRLMKLDVEGHELEVLKGAAELLKNGRIEYIIYEDLNGHKGETSEYLKAHGYSIFKLVKRFKGLALYSPDFEDLYSYEPENFLATKDNNLHIEVNTNPEWRIFCS